MNTVAIVTSVSGLAWALNETGDYRLLSAGDQISSDETLVMSDSARITLDFGDGRQLVLTGTEQAPQETDVPVVILDSPPLTDRVRMAEENQSADASSATLFDGHNFVQLVKIAEMIEADGLTPLNVANIQEYLNPLEMELPEQSDADERRFEPRLETQDPSAGRFSDETPEEPEEPQEPEDPEEPSEPEEPEEPEDPEEPEEPEEPEPPVKPTPTPNEPPVAIDDQNTTDQDTVLTVGSSGVMNNDSDPDGTVLLVIEVNGTGGNVGVPVSGDNGGQFTLNEDGSYTFDPAGDFEALAEGESGTSSITYTITDADGGTDTATLTVTVNGKNDSPVVVADTNNVTEDAMDETGLDDSDANTTIVGGNILANDTDSDNGASFEVTGVGAGTQTSTSGNVGSAVTGTYGSATVNDDGSYRYALDNTNPDVQALAVGETLTDTFSYTATDDQGGTSTTTLTITVNGSNDTPQISLEAGGSAAETVNEGDAALTTSGTLSFADVDSSDEVIATPLEQVITGGTYTGPLPTEAELIDMFDASGTLAGGDQKTVNGLGWAFDSGSESFDGIPEGETLTLTYTVQVEDPHGATDKQDVVITIQGTNDAPQILSSVPDQSDQDASAITNLDVSDYFDDPDTGDALSYSATNLPPGLNIDSSTGIISGTPDNSASQGGNNGVYTVTVTAEDSNGGIVDQAFDWTITNPTPTAVDDSGITDEDTVLIVPANGVLGNDSDPDGDSLTVFEVEGSAGNVNSPVAGDNGGLFSLNNDGSYSFDPDGDFESLNPGEQAQTSVTYTVSDGEGGTDTATLTITVTGQSDGGPGLTITDGNGADVGENSIAEDATSPESGTFTATTPDGLKEIRVGGEVVTLNELENLSSSPVTITGSEGELKLSGFNAGTGEITYEYQQTDTSKDHSAGKNSITDSFAITVTDNNDDSTTPQDLIILVTDTVPVANPDTDSVSEDSATDTASGNVISDTGSGQDTLAADAAEVSGITTGAVGSTEVSGNTGTPVAGDYGTLTLNANGGYSYVLDNDNPAVNALKDGDELNDVFSYTLKDSDGDWSTTTLTITINGSTDGSPDLTVVDENGDSGDFKVDGDITVYESELAAGGPGGESKTAVGTINLDTPDGIESVTLGSSEFSLQQLLDLSSTNQVVDTPQGEITLTGLNVTEWLGGDSASGMPLKADLEYSYTLDTPLDNDTGANSDQNGFENIAVTLKDASDAGETATGSLRVNIIDDEPSVGVPVDTAVFEAGLPLGSEAGVADTSATGTLDVRVGADAAATGGDTADVSFASDQTELEGLGLSSGYDGTGDPIGLVYALSNDDHTLTARKSDGSGNPVGDPVFTVEINNPGAASASYTYTLHQPINHIDGSGDPVSTIELPFAFDVVDGDTDTASGTFNVTVHDDGDASDGERTVTVDEDDTVTFNTSADATGDNTEIPTGSEPSHGIVTINPDGTITYEPSEDYSGQDSFTYKTTNGPEVTEVTVTVDINPIADPPVISATSASIETDEDTSVALGLIAPGRSADQADQNSAGASDGDNPELLGPVTLSGIPSGAQLLDAGGNVVFTSIGSDIGISLTDSGNQINDMPATDLSLTEAEYEALQLLPPPEGADNISVVAKVSSYEVDENGNRLSGVSGNEASATVDVDVKAVTDPVELSFTDDSKTFSQDVDEDTPFDLSSLLKANYPQDHSAANEEQGATSTADIDGSEERWFEISGLPVGSFINGTEVTAGNQPIRVDAPGMSTSDSGFPEINFTAPKDFSGEASNITITLKAQDQDGDSAITTAVEEDSVTLNLTVQPTLDDLSVEGVETEEDTAVQFLQNLTPGDNDGSEEITGLTVKDIPADWVVQDHAGDDVTVSDGSFTVPPADLSGTSPNYLNYTIKPPGHSSLDTELTLDVEVSDAGNETGLTQATKTFPDVPLNITVTPVAERADSDTNGQNGNDVSLVGDHEYNRAGEEDQWFLLGTEAENGDFDLSAGWAVEDDEQLFAALTPELTANNGTQTDPAGSQFRWSEDGGATWKTQTFGGDAVRVPVEYLDTLEFKAAKDFSGQFKINVQAVTVDTDDDGGITVEAVSGNAELTNVLIEPAADEVTTTVTARVKGNEDDEMPLSIRPSSSDPSETFDVTIDGIPDGAELTYGSDTISKTNPGSYTVTDNGDGTWSLNIEEFEPATGAGMTIKAPEHSNDPFTLEVETVSVDTLDVNGDTYESKSDPFVLSINVTPKGVADPADLTVRAPADQSFVEETVDGNGGVMLSDLLDGTPALIDDDGSETLSFKLKDLPTGFGVEGATSLGNGEWVFATTDLANVQITTPTNFSGTSEAFTLAAITTENDGDSLTDERNVQIRITPSPEATMSLSTTTDEDVPAKLDFSAQQQNGEAGETISEVWISKSDLDTATNFTLTYGEGGSALADGQSGVTLDDGWYKLTGNALDNIYLEGDANWRGTGSFTVRYGVEDPGGDGTVSPVSAMSGDQSYDVAVEPITDQPDLSVTTGSDITLSDPGTADMTLNIANQGIEEGDYDGSEQLIRILLDNVPEGVIVKDADFIGGNQWLFITSDNFNGPLTQEITLQVQQEAHSLNGHEIGVTVTTEDAGNGELLTDSTTVSLTTNFVDDGDGSAPPADILTWEQSDFDPTEDTAFALSDAFTGQIESGVTDNGFNITLSALPEGTQVNGMTATTINGETVWTKSGTGGDTELQTLLGSITVTPPADWNSNKGSFVFDARLTTYVPSGVTKDASVNATFDAVQPVTDEPEISISAPAVNEGNDLTFTVELGNEADAPNWSLVDGKLYLQLDESGISGTGELKQGGSTLGTTSVSGVSGIDDGSYYVIDGVNPNDSVSLTYTPPTEYVGGSVGLSAWAQSQENGSTEIKTGTASTAGQINPVNSGYDFTVADVAGTENANQLVEDDKSNVVKLDVKDVGLNDTDGSESIGTVLLRDVPNGFLVYVGDNANEAQLADLSNNAGGDGTTNSWLLGQGEIPGYIGIMPPQYWSGTVSDLRLQVTSGEDTLAEDGVTEKTFDLAVEPQADGLNSLEPTPSFGLGGDTIPLNLNHELKDPEKVGPDAGSYQDESTETLTLEFSGMGEHAAFYVDGNLVSGTGQVTDNGSGSYTVSGLSSEEAEKLSFVQAEGALNNVQVRAQTQETGGGSPSAWTDWKAIDTSGVTEQFGTTGDDNLLWTGQAIDGFGGNDVVQLRFGESVSGTELGNSVSNIEEIDMASRGADSITALRPEDVLNMTDSDNELRISGDNEDSLTLNVNEGDWTQGSAAGGYTTYTGMFESNNVTLEVENTLVE
ncbi:MAG: tandem-95 repeat protein [Alteromonadaceae bacterium]|nr:tandem-95 repeat protein [Alteromonadaceae bacterium]